MCGPDPACTAHPVPSEAFARFFAVYDLDNVCQRYDWREWMQDAPAEGQAHFLLQGDVPIGGFSLQGSLLRHPFLIPPFSDRALFWREALSFAGKAAPDQKIVLEGIAPRDQAVLLATPGCTLHLGQLRMKRPTGPMAAPLDPAFAFAPLLPGDLAQIASVVYAAHAAGYTHARYPRSLQDFTGELSRRFDLFAQTGTLHMGSLVREAATGTLAGVCVAGIYPDSLLRFSTVHQLAVHPDFQRRGLGAALLRRAIDAAAPLSPVITLGVMQGNPAQALYESLGFLPGPCYGYLSYDGGGS